MATTAQRVLTRLGRQHGGYFVTGDAVASGISHRVLSYHAQVGDIERVAHGVYRLAMYPEHEFGDMIVATLWAGPHAVVSHSSALVVYRIAEVMPPLIHVTVARQFGGRRQGVVVHRAALPPEDVRVWEDVPVTTPLRALVDAASREDPSLVRAAAEDALERGLVTRRRLDAALRSRRDAEPLRRILAGDAAGRESV
jgi:predicted transcriptional regulator of viral defense system